MQLSLTLISSKPVHGKTSIMVYAASEDPDKPNHWPTGHFVGVVESMDAQADLCLCCS